MPQISIVIPSFNHGNFINHTIESILNQSFEDFEIVITDDCSSDHSVEVINSFKDKRIKLFVMDKNYGPSFCINNSLKNSLGEYIAFLSSDDMFRTDKLEKQIQYFNKHPETSAVFSLTALIDEKNKIISSKKAFTKSIFNVSNKTRFEWLNYFFFKGNCLCGGSPLIKKSVLEEVGPFNNRLLQLQDFEYWVRLCIKYEIHIIQEELTYYRIHKNFFNSSAPSIPKTNRLLFESKEVLNLYKNIDLSDLKKVFPEYKFGENIELKDFYLAQIALKADNSSFYHKLFAIENLYKLMENTQNVDSLEKLEKYGYKDFILDSSKIPFKEEITLKNFIKQVVKKYLLCF